MFKTNIICKQEAHLMLTNLRDALRRLEVSQGH